ncbi:hypothetical protein SSX86_008373 [Deinandra increscens subsp. villosa]|uniref:HTH myb-type domain-containing protein n=1 Tax=Deinandra increscens subsp. villosa TaxID=3103831 RepID=A0AAP0DG02_9ASTR
MMTSTSELSLECKPQSYSVLLKPTGEQVGSNRHDQTRKLEEFLSCLEEERVKIDAFKRELPLCMQLLTNAMETSRQQLQTYRANQNSLALDEFIPIKNSNGKEPENTSISNNIDNKANWMSSAQLWSQTDSTITPTSTTTHNSTTPNETDIGFNNKERNGGAFLPFSNGRNSSGSTPALISPELALSSGEKKADHNNTKENKSCVRENNNFIKDGNDEVANTQTTMNITGAASGTTTSSQTHRKTRRCWSPDLHRRFVNALQMLGGSQVATPKQIRELMKVDGLTNDEVKSHLQKYRLHTRRPTPSPQPVGNAPPQLVVLGGIWVSPEYATPAGAQTLYTNTTHPTPHYYPPHQDFYPCPVPPPSQPLHHQHNNNNNDNNNNRINANLHHYNHVYKVSSQTTTSLKESSGKSGTATGCGNRSESIEDGKSESGGSWKAESGGDTKTLMLREECEESNQSEITLKF